MVDHYFKVILIGEAGVGKSSLLNQFADSTWDENYSATIGVDFKSKVVDCSGKAVKLNLWDSAGQERFKTLAVSYYRNIHGIIMVYSVDDKRSFQALRTWWEDIRIYAEDRAVVMIIGNKTDLPREVPLKDGAALAEELGCLYAETSAKIHASTAAAFQRLAEAILAKGPPPPLPKLNLEAPKSRPCPECCS